MNNTNLEQKALIVSVLLTLSTALWAIIMAVYTKSMAVALDGAFNVMSAILSSLGVITVGFIQKGYTKKHPMGFYSYEALISLMRSLFLIIMMSFLFIDAIGMILSGGKEIPINAMMVYTLPSIIFCSIGYFYMKHVSQKIETMTLEADLNEWRLSFFIAFAIFCTLIISIILRLTPLSWITRYTDPGVVIFLCITLIKDPVLLVVDSFKHLMLQSSDPEFSRPFRKNLHTFVEENASEFSVGETDIIPIGRMVVVLIEIFPKKSSATLVKFLDLQQSLKEIAKKQFTNVDSIIYFAENSTLE